MFNGLGFTRVNALVATGLLSLSFMQAAEARDVSIFGTPATSVAAGSKYSFTPATTGDSGRHMTFTIVNKPYWATFSKYNGTLSGVPTSKDARAYYGIIISVSDGKSNDSLPAFALTVKAPTVANTAPTIGGAPVTSLEAGMAYNFVPAARDADGDKLTFSISSKPAWATFDAATGRLWGVPSSAQAGSYEEIQISVSDGKVSTALPMFAIEVVPAAPVMHAATLSWTPPTTNVDGTALTNLAGYKVRYGTAPGTYTTTINVSNGLTRYVVENLETGRYYFSMVSVNSQGIESNAAPEVNIQF